MSIKLQPRDLEILSLMSKYNVISTNQICTWFFVNIAKTTVLRRIRLLEKEHYIKRGMTLTNGENTFYLSPKGRKIVNCKPMNHFSNRNTIEHDVLLNHIRWKLESFDLAKDVVPEWEMRSEVFRNHRYKNAKEQLIPDLLMFEPVLFAPQAISIELELTIKSKVRYKRIFEHYGAKDSVTKIWYFCRNINELNRILDNSRASIFNLKNRMWFSITDEFLKDEDPSVWQASTLKWHRLSTLDFNNYKKPAHPRTQGVSTQNKKDRAGVDSDKSLESQTNTLILFTPEAPYPVPDHSHPTSESGQVRDMEIEKNKISELDDMGLDKCG